MTVRIAQLSDTHVVEAGSSEELYVDNNGRLAEAVSSIRSMSPELDAVVVTGDLTQWGEPEEFAELTSMLSGLPCPVFAIPGNHDDRTETRSAFPATHWVDAGHASWVEILGGVRIIGLDSTSPGLPGAVFDAEREDWLRSVLSTNHPGATLLAMHHPPFRTGIDWMDANGFDGLDRFLAVLDDDRARDGQPVSPSIDRIMCGHMHRPISSTVGGVVVEVGLATAVHVELELEPGGPTQLIRDPAGYRIHVVDGRSIVSHTRYIGTGESAFVPSWSTDT